MNRTASLPYKDHFSLSSVDLQKILNIALSQGGNFSEIFLEYRVYSSINMEEDIIKETSENIMLGAGIRVVYGDQTGYGYTNDLSLEKITRAALTASSIAKGPPSKKSFPFRSAPVIPNYYPILHPAQDESLENKIVLASLKADFTLSQIDDSSTNYV